MPISYMAAWGHYHEELVLHLRRRKATVRDYRSALLDWFQFLEASGKRWDQATPKDLARHLDRPARGPGGRQRPARPLSPNSRAWKSTVILAFYAWARHAGLLRRNRFDGVRPERRSETLARALPLGDVRTLLAAVVGDERTLVAVALAYWAFLRRGEIARARIEDLDLDLGVMVVHGKGGYVDTVQIPPDLATILRAHLAWRAGRGLSTRAGPLFWNLTHPDRHLTPDTVGRLIAGPMHAVGIADSAHALRHTGATALLEALDGNVYPVSRALRHRSLRSTQVYVRRFDRQLAGYVAQLPDPRVAGPDVEPAGA